MFSWRIWTKMNNIQVATGMNCIFLRFNPDNFKVGG